MRNNKDFANWVHLSNHAALSALAAAFPAATFTVAGRGTTPVMYVGGTGLSAPQFSRWLKSRGVGGRSHR